MMSMPSGLGAPSWPLPLRYSSKYSTPEVFFEVLKIPSVELIERVVLTVSATHNEDWRT